MQNKTVTTNPLLGINPLYQSPVDVNGNVKYSLNMYSTSEFNNKCRNVKYSLNFQRYYLFTIVNGVGDTWQRDLFLSIIRFEPIGQIEWVNTINEEGEVEIRCESSDGQQRTRTFMAIMDNQVRLPKNATIWVDGKEEEIPEFNLSDIASKFPQYYENWLKTYGIIVIESNLTKPEKHQRFINVNNHNVLSDQDIRSSYDNPLSNWLNEMLFSESPSHNFMRVEEKDLTFVHMPKLSAKGKLLMEIFSKVLVYGFNGKYTNLGKGAIDSLYELFNEGDKTQKDIDNISNVFIDLLKKMDTIITKSKNKDFWKKRDVLLLMIVLWELNKEKKSFDVKILSAEYETIIAKLKKENCKLNDWAEDAGFLFDKNNAHPKNKLAETIRQRDNNFSACYSSGDSGITLEFTVELIKEKLEKAGITSVKDSRRTFTREQKQQVLAMQNGKCGCCDTKLNPKNTSSYEGDHIKTHSEGGKTEIDNCEILCLSCHQIKSNHPKQYAMMRNVAK
jgi:5-methylcytosine-specific restriction endonuclease McrA